MIKPKFSVGEKVAFSDAHFITHTGEVIQVSKKTYFVMILSDQNGQHYSCHENNISRLA